MNDSAGEKWGIVPAIGNKQHLSTSVHRHGGTRFTSMFKRQTAAVNHLLMFQKKGLLILSCRFKGVFLFISFMSGSFFQIPNDHLTCSKSLHRKKKKGTNHHSFNCIILLELFFKKNKQKKSNNTKVTIPNVLFYQDQANRFLVASHLECVCKQEAADVCYRWRMHASVHSHTDAHFTLVLSQGGLLSSGERDRYPQLPLATKDGQSSVLMHVWSTALSQIPLREQ